MPHLRSRRLDRTGLRTPEAAVTGMHGHSEATGRSSDLPAAWQVLYVWKRRPPKLRAPAARVWTHTLSNAIAADSTQSLLVELKREDVAPETMQGLQKLQQEMLRRFFTPPSVTRLLKLATGIVQSKREPSAAMPFPCNLPRTCGASQD